MDVNDPLGTFTPYSTVKDLTQNDAFHVPELERERINSYQVYEQIYWSVPHTFKLTMRGTEDQPIYIPNARTVVNETAHYLLKGMLVSPETEDPELEEALTSFLKRERFYSKFQTAKWSGVVRGDWLLHLTADPEKPEGSRISVNSVDPASYFPRYNEDDLDELIGVDLVEFIVGEDNKTKVKQLRYTYVWIGGNRRVIREERILEMENWFDETRAKVTEQTLPPELLPEGIGTIPVYHFKNIDWQGQPYGSSELRGFEGLMGSINQTISDEELALALVGLGMYATDAPEPAGGWVVSPGTVAEVPTNSSFKRVEGITSVNPMLEHLEFLTNALYEGSSTFRTSQVDVQLAESGVALAMRFLPTLAKLEQRDWAGTAVLENFWFDWKFWWAAYEGEDFTEIELSVTLGEKLPTNRKEVLNELNNMLDRQVIDRKYYREKIAEFGYEFPDDMHKRVLAEQAELAKVRMLNSGTTANNGNRPNESAGTEADQSAEEQQRT